MTALLPIMGVSVNVRIEDGLYYIENYYQANALEKAEGIFNSILAKDPDHAAARAGLAMALMSKYVYAESDPSTLQLATAHAEAAVRADEHLALANLSRAYAYDLNGQFEQAHALLDRVDILDPNNKMSLLRRANIFARQGNLTEASNILDQAIKIHPSEDSFLIMQGRILERQENFGGAERSFRQAIDISGDNPLTYAQLSHMLHMQNETSEAIKIIQDGLKVNETALLYSNLGAYLFFQGHYDVAASAFEKSLELEGDTHNYLYWSNLADSYRWLPGRKKDAQLAYKRAIQLLNVNLDKFPDSVNLYTRSALFHAKLGDLTGAQNALSKLDVSAQLQAVEYYRLAVTAEIMANRTNALEFLGQAIKAGYPMNEITNDPELKELRQDIAYHKLLAQN